MKNLALFGCGRIGAVHAKNISSSASANLKYVIDPNKPEAELEFANLYGAIVATESEVFNDSSIDAIVIASSTPSHVDLLIKAAAVNIAVFCEKPLDLELSRVDHAISNIEKASINFMLGFQRRFDPTFQKLEERVRRGDIGNIEMIQITSRDPSPPSKEYLLNSGGIFKDMMIHDFDMALWLLQENIDEVYATGSCLVSPDFEAVNDIDTASVLLKSRTGKLVHITNSRRTAYGYDQRVEVMASEGMLQAQNKMEAGVSLCCWGQGGVSDNKPMNFFMDRYQEAYMNELNHFIQLLIVGSPSPVTANDGRNSLVLAEAAERSFRTKTPVFIES